MTMDLSSLIQSKKKALKPTKMFLTDEQGRKFEVFEGVTRELDFKVVPFVVDEKPHLQIASIIPGLFLSAQDPVFHFELLKHHNIKYILSLGIDPTIKFDEIKYYYMEILDLPEFDIKLLFKRCIHIINSHRNENILVHCNAGVSRSPTIVIAYLMMQEKMTYQQAYNHVKAIRNCIRPNDGFIRQLMSLEFQKEISNETCLLKD